MIAAFADLVILLAIAAALGFVRAWFPRSGTWRDVAKRFAGCPMLPGRVISWTLVMVGERGCRCRVVVMPSGLGIEPMWLASWFFASLVLPWSAIGVVRRRVFPFLVIHGDPPVTLHVTGRVWRAARDQFDRLPAADRKSVV